jgi:hypothetical protein
MSIRVRKKREEVEMKYVHEWIAKNFPNAIRVMTQVPMGDTPQQLAKGRTDVDAYWFWRYGPRADAIIVLPDKVILVEAETKRPVVGLSELEVYANEFYRSPHLAAYTRLPLEVVLLTPVWDRHTAEVCAKKGWKYVIWCPDWLIPHLKRWGVLPREEERNELDGR